MIHTSHNTKNFSHGIAHLLIFSIFILLIVVCFSVVTPVNAQYDEAVGGLNNEPPRSGFIPLVGIPYINTDEPMSLPKYVNALYTASISIAAFLAVVKIIFAGVKYMLSDVVTTKEDAKKDIRGAVIGLLIVVGAVLILNTINPQLSGLSALTGPEVIVTGNYVPDPVLERCKKLGGSENCIITDCKYLETITGAIGWYGYIPKYMGVNYVGNKVLCSSICAFHRGLVKSSSSGDKCVYPKNSSIAAGAIMDKKFQELKLSDSDIVNKSSFVKKIDFALLEQNKISNHDLTAFVDSDIIGYVYIPYIDTSIIEDGKLNEECFNIAGKNFLIIRTVRGAGTHLYCVRD